MSTGSEGTPLVLLAETGRLLEGDNSKEGGLDLDLDVSTAEMTSG